MGGDTLTNNDRKKFDMVLTLDVHMRDIVEGFVRDSIMDPSEFEWESQLRFLLIRSYFSYLFLFIILSILSIPIKYQLRCFISVQIFIAYQKRGTIHFIRKYKFLAKVLLGSRSG